MQSKNKRGGREPRQSAIKMADKKHGGLNPDLLIATQKPDSSKPIFFELRKVKEC